MPNLGILRRPLGSSEAVRVDVAALLAEGTLPLRAQASRV